jgi:copper ion binding protein
VVAVYLATVAVFSVLLGWLFQSVIGGEAARAAGQTGHLVPHWLAFTCAIIITVLMAWHVYRSLRMRYRVGPAETSDAPKLRFDVQGMTCGNCVAHVENAVEGVEGVQAVSVDLEEGRALVAGSPDPSAVEAAIREAGYEASYLGEEQPMQCEYAVEGMTCKNCAMHVEKAVRDVKGVDSCVVDLEGKRARVQGEDFDRDAVARAIEEAGYEARPTQ